MKRIKLTPKVSKERAIQLAMNLNGVPREIAEKYTDSELRECLRLLKLKANFLIKPTTMKKGYYSHRPLSPSHNSRALPYLVPTNIRKSIFAMIVTVNQGYPSEQTFVVPMQYGIPHYQYVTSEVIQRFGIKDPDNILRQCPTVYGVRIYLDETPTSYHQIVKIK